GPPRRVRPHRRTPPPRRPPARAAAGDLHPSTRRGVTPMTAQPTPTPTASGPADGRPFAEVDLAIEGMTCASCVARVEKRLNRVDGATATVNLPLESAHVVLAADVSDADLVAAGEKAGYTARVTTRPTPVDHASPSANQAGTPPSQAPASPEPARASRRATRTAATTAAHRSPRPLPRRATAAPRRPRPLPPRTGPLPRRTGASRTPRRWGRRRTRRAEKPRSRTARTPSRAP